MCLKKNLSIILKGQTFEPLNKYLFSSQVTLEVPDF